MVEMLDKEKTEEESFVTEPFFEGIRECHHILDGLKGKCGEINPAGIMEIIVADVYYALKNGGTLEDLRQLCLSLRKGYPEEAKEEVNPNGHQPSESK